MSTFRRLNRTAWLLLATIVAGASVCLSFLAAQAAEKRLIKADDIYLFHWVADPQISPDGSQVAYTYVGVNAKHDGYDTSLWLAPAAGVGLGTLMLVITGVQPPVETTARKGAEESPVLSVAVTSNR